MSRISLKTIAKELNLSVASVSWVLSGKGEERGISSSTIGRVMRYAEKINYRPNMLARGLNMGVSNVVGLIIPSISDSFYSAISKSVEASLEKYNYSLMICSSESELARENKMIDVLKSHQVDGIAIAPTKFSKVEIERLIAESYPFVLFDRFFTDIATNYVLVDNEESSFRLVNRLAEKGRKKIALITVNRYLQIMHLRENGYLNALKKNRIAVLPQLIGSVTFHGYEYDVPKVLERILRDVPDVDGFFFTSHILAIEAFRYFNEHGIDYNRKFGLACIHEEALFPIIALGINVAMMPVEEMGKKIVDILMRQINGRLLGKNKDEISEEVLPCEIVFRD